MKGTAFLLSAFFLGAMATAASAQGIASLSWDSCPGPTNRQVSPDNFNSLWASVINHSASHTGYEVQIVLGSGNAGALRDAWRFDATGCQGPARLTMDHLPPAAAVKGCPSFAGTRSLLQIKQYAYDGGSGKARSTIANVYPQGGTGTINPFQRYFLARWTFDHTFSVNGAGTPGGTCGGLEIPVCAHFRVAKFNLQGAGEIEWAFGQQYVTSNDATNSTGCPGATPAANRTWGSIKVLHKR